MKKYAIILAAGKGTRMKSDLPKVMHQVCGVPMVEHLVKKLEQLRVDEIIVVVGHKSEMIMEHLQNRVTFVEQKEQLGTGHAIMQVKGYLKEQAGKTLILTGDTPLLSIETMERAYKGCETSKGIVVTMQQEDPRGYGRILRDENKNVLRIIEEKDASEQNKMINEVNTGIFCFDNQCLFTFIDEIENNNSQNEYYLTDLVEIFHRHQASFTTVSLKHPDEAIGINDRLALSKAEKTLRQMIIEKHLLQGVSMIDPDSVYIDETVEIGENVTIYPNVILKGMVTIGANTEIGMNTEIQNSAIGENVSIKQSVIQDSFIGNFTSIGPFAHIRPQSVIKENCRIGNFVETKKSTFENGSKASHLSYIGDAEIGENVNLGCGSITVNYDGKNKHKTIIKNGAFIGCNVNLVAPVTVEENTIVAAGSTITKDVPANALAIARSKQENKENYVFKLNKK